MAASMQLSRARSIEWAGIAGDKVRNACAHCGWYGAEFLTTSSPLVPMGEEWRAHKRTHRATIIPTPRTSALATR